MTSGAILCIAVVTVICVGGIIGCIVVYKRKKLEREVVLSRQNTAFGSFIHEPNPSAKASMSPKTRMELEVKLEVERKRS